MSQEQKPFAVKDRRHFTPDGQPRPEPTAETSEGPPKAPPVSEPPPPAIEADFGSFLLSLGAQAKFLLSQEAASGEEPAPLEEARSLIAILEMLKDKTQGRRTPREDGILEGILYELRMGYVSRAGVGGA